MRRRYVPPPKLPGSEQRRVYVLPAELVDRIRAYGHETGCRSEVEAARRLLDDALVAHASGNALRRA